MKHYENSLNQLKTAGTNSRWAYIWEGLLSEGFLRLTFGGLISGGLIFIFYFFWGGRGYYRNFTVCHGQSRLSRPWLFVFVIVVRDHLVKEIRNW